MTTVAAAVNDVLKQALPRTAAADYSSGVPPVFLPYQARSQQLGSMENGPDGTLVEGCQLIPTNVAWSLDKTDKGKGPVSLVFRFSPDVSLGFLVDRATLARLAADASEAE